MLNKNILASISFVAGVAIGSVTTYFIVNKKAQEKINIETNETREYYAKLEKELRDDCDILEPVPEEPVIKEGTDLYSKMANVYNPIPEQQFTANAFKAKDQMPYVISPDEFGEFDDYNKIFLTCCHDGYIVDEDLEILDRNSLDDIGVEFNMDKFGEYEDDILHIRNDKVKTDFEITRISDDYSALTHSSINEGKEDLEE